MLRLRFVLCVLAFAAMLLLAPAEVGRADEGVYTVDSTRDAGDEVINDGACATFLGECTLRAAIQQANAHPGHDTIAIPSGTFTLTTGGVDEDEAGTGDLDITDDVTIYGTNGANVTIIDGNSLDRVFDVHAANVEISSLTIAHGQAGNFFPPGPVGGGIYNRSGNLTLTNVSIDSNNAWSGAGIANSGNLVMERSVVVNNGAGSISSSGTLALTNVTISGNTAGGYPDTSGTGGLAVSGVTSLTNVTITNNGASYTSIGGILNSSDNLTIKNSIVSNNFGQNCGWVKPIISLGYNLENTDTCDFHSEGDITNTDPMLGPLGNILGQTPGHYLQQGSPAIDAGSPDCPPPDSDQRGWLRPQGQACDIGAYEAKASVLPIEIQIGDCLDEIDVVWGRDDATQRWLAFEPGAPPDFQTLIVFSAHEGYFIHASEHCTITAPFPNEHPIYPGWNLIGWR